LPLFSIQEGGLIFFCFGGFAIQSCFI